MEKIQKVKVGQLPYLNKKVTKKDILAMAKTLAYGEALIVPATAVGVTKQSVSSLVGSLARYVGNFKVVKGEGEQEGQFVVFHADAETEEAKPKGRTLRFKVKRSKVPSARIAHRGGVSYHTKKEFPTVFRIGRGHYHDDIVSLVAEHGTVYLMKRAFGNRETAMNSYTYALRNIHGYNVLGTRRASKVVAITKADGPVAAVTTGGNDIAPTEMIQS